jgi:hypothetical protein
VSKSASSLDWRLFAAAGAAALAAASGAEASIIYVNPSVKPDARLSATVNFNIDGVPLLLADNASQSNAALAAAARPGTGGLAPFFIGTGGYVQKFALGAPVAGAPGQAFIFRTAKTYNHAIHAGDFTTGKTGFAGFQLPASKGGGMGWLRVDIISQNNNDVPDEITAIDWAYNDAGGGINAGQGIPSAVPEPSALSLMAIGSAGVLAWRRRRSVGSASTSAS